MLKVFLCVCSYNPYDGPNENPEAELPLVAGKYLYVYGNMDDDGFYEGEDEAAPLTQDKDSYFCTYRIQFILFKKGLYSHQTNAS